ncbi:MAG: D-alanyl-D-alanine carboxypeptidase [Hyphomicrobiales bacterium]|nr:D-alanyl-D-alanine carboxypeptidase [Hyphomicrobiales bacterium]
MLGKRARLIWAMIACAGSVLAATRASAEATLVIEVESGKVLAAENAGYPWYPASVTKLMTAYVTLRAVKEGRLTLDRPLTVSANAASQAPVKMGFPPGTIVTVDNALKMLMVKSANDMAVVLAEGVAGSVENFADLMNRNAQKLGMVQSSFVNPNGLPADDQITSARDLGILARAIIRELPEYDYFWHLPGIRFGRMVQRNYNTLIGRYPGADGMKTGFICASGFNLVASATRDGKRLIAVVLGAPSSAARAMKAAQLLERGFNGNAGLSWLMPSLGTVDTLQPVNAAPPNLRDEMCGGHRKRIAAENEDDVNPSNTSPDSPYGMFLASLQPKSKGAALLQDGQMGEPVLVYTGIKPPGPGVLQRLPGEAKPKKKTATASVKPAAGTPGDGKQAAAPAGGPKPATATTGGPKPAAAKDAAANTSATSGEGKPKPKPPAPKPAAKPAPKPAAGAAQTSQVQ